MKSELKSRAYEFWHIPANERQLIMCCIVAISISTYLQILN